MNKNGKVLVVILATVGVAIVAVFFVLAVWMNLLNTSRPSIPQEKLSAEGKFCGGIVANLPQNQCPSGYKCQLDGNYPDAGGVCAKRGLFDF